MCRQRHTLVWQCAYLKDVNPANTIFFARCMMTLLLSKRITHAHFGVRVNRATRCRRKTWHEFRAKSCLLCRGSFEHVLCFACYNLMAREISLPCLSLSLRSCVGNVNVDILVPLRVSVTCYSKKSVRFFGYLSKDSLLSLHDPQLFLPG